MDSRSFTEIAVVGYPLGESAEALEAVFEAVFANPNRHFEDHAELGAFHLPGKTSRRRKSADKADSASAESSRTRKPDYLLELRLHGQWYRLIAMGRAENGVNDPFELDERLAAMAGTIYVVNGFFVWPSLAHKGFFGSIAHAQKRLRFDLSQAIAFAEKQIWSKSRALPISGASQLDEVKHLLGRDEVILHYDADDRENPITIEGLEPADAARLYAALASVPSSVVRDSTHEFTVYRQVSFCQDRPFSVLTHKDVKQYCGKAIDDHDFDEAFDFFTGPNPRERAMNHQAVVALLEYTPRAHPKSPRINLRPSAAGGRLIWNGLKVWLPSQVKRSATAVESVVTATAAPIIAEAASDETPAVTLEVEPAAEAPQVSESSTPAPTSVGNGKLPGMNRDRAAAIVAGSGALGMAMILGGVTAPVAVPWALAVGLGVATATLVANAQRPSSKSSEGLREARTLEVATNGTSPTSAGVNRVVKFLSGKFATNGVAPH